MRRYHDVTGSRSTRAEISSSESGIAALAVSGMLASSLSDDGLLQVNLPAHLPWVCGTCIGVPWFLIEE
jgi:hypothetical protein